MEKEFDFWTGVGLFFIVIGSIIAVGAFPLALIWALNGLFSLTIPYDFFHWSCAFVLLVLLKAEVTSK